MELIYTLIFSIAIISALFIASIWVVEIWYSVQYMRESLKNAEREINALTSRIRKHEIATSHTQSCILPPKNCIADVTVRMEETEKRVSIVSQTNFAKIEKLEGKINLLLTRFELFEQSTRLSMAVFSNKAELETLSKKIDAALKH